MYSKTSIYNFPNRSVSSTALREVKNIVMKACRRATWKYKDMLASRRNCYVPLVEEELDNRKVPQSNTPNTICMFVKYRWKCEGNSNCITFLLKQLERIHRKTPSLPHGAMGTNETIESFVTCMLPSRAPMRLSTLHFYSMWAMAPKYLSSMVNE